MAFGHLAVSRGDGRTARPPKPTAARLGWDALPGGLAAGLVLGALGAGGAGLLLSDAVAHVPTPWTDAHLRTVLGFTVLQAALSALLSVAFAVPAARALSRRRNFPGRSLLIALLPLPMVIPPLVGVLAVLEIFGRAGIINSLLGLIGLETRVDVYGLTGILIAHLFFNMPFAVRVLLQGLERIPGETWRLAQQLNLSGPQVFRLVEWPVLRTLLPGLAGLIFLLCFTSFAIVLAIGGGPPNTTLEVAIYQAIRFDFDVGAALGFALVQVTVCGAVVAVLGRFARNVGDTIGLRMAAGRPDLVNGWGRTGDILMILVTAFLLLGPLTALIVDGLTGPLASTLSRPELWAAAGRSLIVALATAGLALILGGSLVWTTRLLRARMNRHGTANGLETLSVLVLVVPPFVVASGWFLLLRPVTDVFAAGLYLVVGVNVLMALPFVVKILGPAAHEIAARHDRLCSGLAMSRWQRLRLVDLPLLRRPIGLALGLTAALSFGDLSVIALVGNPDTQTLPLYLYQSLGAYRSDDAAVVALTLVAGSLLLFAAFDRITGRHG